MTVDLGTIASDFFKAEAARKASELNAKSTRSREVMSANEACQASMLATAALSDDADKALSKAEWDASWSDITPPGTDLAGPDRTPRRWTAVVFQPGHRREPTSKARSLSLGDITPPSGELRTVRPADPADITMASYERHAAEVEALAKQLGSELQDIGLYRDRMATRAEWMRLAFGVGVAIVVALALVGAFYVRHRVSAAAGRGPVPSSSRADVATAPAGVGATYDAAQLAAGGRFELAPKVITLSRTLQISRNTTLSGAGVDATVLTTSTTGSAIVVDQGATLTLSDLTVLHAGVQAADVIVVDGTLQATNVRISGGREDASITGAGVLLRQSARATISRSAITANAIGLAALGSSGLFVSRSSIFKNLARGVSLRNRSNAVITDNTVSGNGYELTGQDYWQGIALDESATATISGNTVRDNAGIGIQFRDASAGSVSKNVVENNALNIARYGSPQTSRGGIVLGTQGTSQDPRPTVHSDNSFAGNEGGGLVDYRPSH